MINLFLQEGLKCGYEIDYNIENKGENNFKDESIYSKPTDEQLKEVQKLLNAI